MKKYFLFSLTIVAMALYAVEPQVHDITACLGGITELRSSCNNAEYYVWSDSVSSTDSYLFTPTTEGEFAFGVHAYGFEVDTADNLMVNGGFEQGYKGFTSEFKAITKNGNNVIDPHNVYSGGYDNGTNYGEYYAISTNAHNFWTGYYNIQPHSGKYFMVVDASDKKYVWKSTTGSENPNLKIEQGKTYLFSCWTAYPNTGKELGDPVAKLQFTIQYQDLSFSMVEENLGDAFSVLEGNPSSMSDSERYKWRKHSAVWTSPVSSDYVIIGLKNSVSSTEGNDFCLDDIIFQPINPSSEELAIDSFVISAKDCTCDIPLYSMWNDVLFVDNYNAQYTSFQWYKNSHAIHGATMQYYRLPKVSGNDQYMCEMKDASGNTYESCEYTFSQAKVSSNFPNGDHATRAPIARRTRCQFGQLQVEEITYDDGSVEYRKIIAL